MVAACAAALLLVAHFAAAADVPAPDAPAPAPTLERSRWVERAAYQSNSSKTGAVTRKLTWKKELRMGRGRAITGFSQGSDYVWMDGLSTHTQDVVQMHFFTRYSAVASLPPDVDGIMGIQDATKGSFLSSLYGRGSNVNAKEKTHQYALNLGLYLPEKKRFMDGSFQFHGYDSGTFHEPLWTATKTCRLDGKVDKSCMILTGLVINDNIDLLANADAAAAPAEEEALVRSASSAISLPMHLVAKLVDAGIAPVSGFLPQVKSVKLTFKAGDGSPGFTVTLGAAELLQGEFEQEPDKGGGTYCGVVQGKPKRDSQTRVVLGAPFFRAGNVIFETHPNTGARARVGFSNRRENVGASDEFQASPVHSAPGFGTASIAIGGPWGRVQTGFRVLIDTNWAGFAVAEGVHIRDVDQRPFVGNFFHAVFVLLVVFPGLIFLVLRDAARQIAAAGGASASIPSASTTPADATLPAAQEMQQVRSNKRLE